MRRTIAHAYTMPNAIAYLNTCITILIQALPILIHWLGFRLSATYLNTCNAYLNTLSRLSAPYLNTCTAYLNTLSRLSDPYPNTCTAYFYTDTTRQPIRIEQRRTLGSRQPIRIEFYVTRVVSQSESSITSPESTRLGLRTLLGSRLFSARYSLS